MYLLPVSQYAKKAHQLNEHGRCLCGSGMKGIKSKELGKFKLCANCQDKINGVGFGRAPISAKGICN